MTFKTPSPSTYFGSLLIAAPIAALVYWILQTQGMANNGIIALGAGLLIGHLIGNCVRPSAQQRNGSQAKASSKTSTPSSSGEMISLYVGNLAYNARQDDVRKLFEQYGKVESVRIMTDRTTRRPRGYCFVEMESAAARNAISQLDNTEFCGRNLRVSEAKQRE